MVYADYEYYTAVYLGSAIDENDFQKLSTRASSYLDYITMGKAKCNADLESLKTACCAIAEMYMTIEAAHEAAGKAVASCDTAELQSQSVGSWSKTYRAAGDTATAMINALESEKRMLADTARQYLAHTGLLYRGGRCL